MDTNELNKLNAKILKAKLRGNQEKVNELEQQLKNAQKQGKRDSEDHEDPDKSIQKEESKVDTEYIAPLDAQGRLLTSLISKNKPKLEPEDMQKGSRRGIKKESIHDVDIDYSKRQRHQESDIDTIYMKNILKMGSRYKESHSSRSGRDEDEEVDMSPYIDKKEYMTEEKRREYEMKEAIRADRRWTSILNSCKYCFNNPEMPKQISIGQYTYLTLPLNYRVTPYHCQIVPLTHIWSYIEADEEIVNEIQRFQDALTRMAKHMHMGIIFIEEVRGSPGRRHCVIDCIPVSKEIEQDVPLYFRKELQDIDDEWQASNHKLIDTSKKGIRRLIPKGFPYFHVQWSKNTGSEGGYAHIIEDEHQFPQMFGLDILCGMMDLGSIRSHREENTREQQKQYVHDFLKKWKHYDWTRSLD